MNPGSTLGPQSRLDDSPSSNASLAGKQNKRFCIWRGSHIVFCWHCLCLRKGKEMEGHFLWFFLCFYPGFHTEFSVFTCCELKRRDTVPETKRRLRRRAVRRGRRRPGSGFKPNFSSKYRFPRLRAAHHGSRSTTGDFREGVLKHTFPIQSTFVTMEKGKKPKSQSGGGWINCDGALCCVFHKSASLFASR